jgi:hypothetical protein
MSKGRYPETLAQFQMQITARTGRAQTNFVDD